MTNKHVVIKAKEQIEYVDLNRLKGWSFEIAFMIGSAINAPVNNVKAVALAKDIFRCCLLLFALSLSVLIENSVAVIFTDLTS